MNKILLVGEWEAGRQAAVGPQTLRLQGIPIFVEQKEAFQCYRHDVCVLRLPPGFPAVPQYLSHTPVVPQTLTEPDEGLFPIRLFVQPFSVAKGFRLTRTRTWGQPTCRRAWRKPSHVYDLRWLRRLSHLNSARRTRCIYS